MTSFESDKIVEPKKKCVFNVHLKLDNSDEHLEYKVPKKVVIYIPIMNRMRKSNDTESNDKELNDIIKIEIKSTSFMNNLQELDRGFKSLINFIELKKHINNKNKNIKNSKNNKVNIDINSYIDVYGIKITLELHYLYKQLRVDGNKFNYELPLLEMNKIKIFKPNTPIHSIGNFLDWVTNINMVKMIEYIQYILSRNIVIERHNRYYNGYISLFNNSLSKFSTDHIYTRRDQFNLKHLVITIGFIKTLSCKLSTTLRYVKRYEYSELPEILTQFYINLLMNIKGNLNLEDYLKFLYNYVFVDIYNLSITRPGAGIYVNNYNAMYKIILDHQYPSYICNLMLKVPEIRDIFLFDIFEYRDFIRYSEFHNTHTNIDDGLHFFDRLPEKSMKHNEHTIVTKEEFQHNFDTLTLGIFNDIEWDNIIIAGGFLTKLLACNINNSEIEPSTDIDIFIYGCTTVKSKNIRLRYLLNYFSTKYKNIIYVMNGLVVTMIIPDYPFNIQIIITKHRSAFQITNDFDMTHINMYYQNKTIIAGLDALYAFKYKKTHIKNNKISNIIIARIVKAIERGFSVYINMKNIKIIKNYGNIRVRQWNGQLGDARSFINNSYKIAITTSRNIKEDIDLNEFKKYNYHQLVEFDDVTYYRNKFIKITNDSLTTDGLGNIISIISNTFNVSCDIIFISYESVLKYLNSNNSLLKSSNWISLYNNDNPHARTKKKFIREYPPKNFDINNIGFIDSRTLRYNITVNDVTYNNQLVIETPHINYIVSPFVKNTCYDKNCVCKICVSPETLENKGESINIHEMVKVYDQTTITIDSNAETIDSTPNDSAPNDKRIAYDTSYHYEQRYLKKDIHPFSCECQQKCKANFNAGRLTLIFKKNNEEHMKFYHFMKQLQRYIYDKCKEGIQTNKEITESMLINDKWDSEDTFSISFSLKYLNNYLVERIINNKEVFDTFNAEKTKSMKVRFDISEINKLVGDEFVKLYINSCIQSIIIFE